EMLLFHPERAANLPVRLRPVPERPGMGFIVVACEGAPALELACFRHVQVGALEMGRFGDVVQGNGPSICVSGSLNPIRKPSANARYRQSSGQRENAPKKAFSGRDDLFNNTLNRGIWPLWPLWLTAS